MKTREKNKMKIIMNKQILEGNTQVADNLPPKCASSPVIQEMEIRNNICRLPLTNAPKASEKEEAGGRQRECAAVWTARLTSQRAVWK